MVLLESGEVWSAGLNDWGQLGHSAGEQHTLLPRRVAGLPHDVCSVAAGHFNTFAATRSGELWAFGRNREAQLGLGDGAASQVGTPARVPLDDAVVHVAAGPRHSLAVTRAGTLYAWGVRSLLGLGAERWRLRLSRNEAVPCVVRALRGVRIVAAAAGGSHSAVADEDGRVYTFGEGAFSQLGTGSSTLAAEPVLVTGVASATQLACGGLHTLVATHDGAAFAWGANEHGGLGLGDVDGPQLRTPSRIPGVALARVSAGWKHSSGVSADGKLYAWGWGGTAGESEQSSGGQLGFDSECDFWAPVEVPLGDGVRALQVSCGFNPTAGIFVQEQTSK